MLLRDFLASEGIGQREFARRVGVTEGAVSKWLRPDGTIPRPEQMTRIGEVTAGKVGPADFYGQPSAEAADAA